MSDDLHASDELPIALSLEQVQQRFESWRRLDVHQLQLLIWNGDLATVKVAPQWKKIALREK